MPDKLVVKKVSKEVDKKKTEPALESGCIEYSVFSLNPCPGDIDSNLIDEACNLNYGIHDDRLDSPLELGQVLEVQATDPLLELSNLTDDSKLLAADAPAGDGKQSNKNNEQPMEIPPTRTRQGRLFSIFDTQKSSRDVSDSSPSTPVPSLPPSKDGNSHRHGHRLDDFVNDSKYLRRSQSEISIRIDDFNPDEFDKLVSCLYGNKDLTSVEVTRLRNISNQRCRTLAEVALLVTSLRSMPNLTKVILNSFNTSDLGMVCSLIKGVKTLEKFHLHLISGTVDRVLLDILADVQSLKEISLDVQSSFPLYLLLASESIVRIAVPSETFSFKERHLDLSIQALSKNNNLRILDLKPKMSPSDVRLLSFGVRRNSSLKVLRFSFLTDETQASAALQHLCESMATNSSLRTVVNHYAKLLHVPALDAYRMIKILKSHDSLKTFDLFDDETAEAEMNDDIPSPWENSIFSTLLCHYDIATISTQEPCQKMRHWNDSRRSDPSSRKASWTITNWLDVWRQ